MNRNHFLSVAIATALVSSANYAAAVALVTDVSSPTSFPYALENGKRTILKNGSDAFVFRIPTPLYTLDTNSPFFIKLTMRSGVKFNSNGAWGMSCQVVDSDGITTTTKTGSIQLGVGTNELSLQLPIAAGATAFLKTTGYCDVSGTEFGLSGLSDVTYDVAVTYKPTLATKTIPYSGKYISFVQAINPIFTPSPAVVDVKQASKQFVEDAGNSITEKTARIGYISFSRTVDTAYVYTGGTNLEVTDIVEVATITLNGSPLGAFNTTGGLYLTSAASCAAANAITSTTSLKRASGSYVTFTLDAAQTKNLNTPINGSSPVISVCLVSRGETAIDKGIISVKLTGTALNSYVPNFGAEADFTTISKNGYSTKVLNIPSPTDADKFNLRINNMSTQSGKVYGTLYDITGKQIGTPNAVLGEVTSRSVLVISGANNLAKLFGLSETAAWDAVKNGRAWMQVDAEVSDASVQNLVRSGGGSGPLLNLSDGVKGR